MIAETCTYRPPICEITFAYSFSAPTARIFPGCAAAIELPQPVNTVAVATSASSAPMTVVARRITTGNLAQKRD